ncbi:hypothetical protein HK103_002744 [Boothiomyces macroporosus]|uniref:Uncharacterized protein n=1 Tax=Boothiomyces macroporosus TaxID=261099 RepID=A0AAD5UNU3_9FUNG|nr:hypothetical protein HK103_002744 [Boothiomyces macroporosus]
MDVESLPTSDSSISSINKVIQTDGIDIHSAHLKRPELLDKLSELSTQYRFVRLTSPAASGKSSLLKLYQHTFNETTKVIWISCLSDKSCFELLASKGIDLENCKYKESIRKQNTVVFFDDAQAKYAEGTFWTLLIKFSPTWLPNNFRFIISSTHLLSGGTISPVEFKSLPALNRSDFLLTSEESDEFLELPGIGLPQQMRYEKVKQVLIRECGGLIGALRQSIDSLQGRFAKDSQPSETALLQHFLSNDILSYMARCFGSAHSKPIGNDFKMFLKKIFVDDKLFLDGLTNEQDDDSYLTLKKAGILVKFPDSTFGFSSQLAKRYYFKWVFPNRSKTAPSSLQELIRNVVSNMSSTVLKNCTLPGDLPKEAVFQHLFMEGLALYTPPSCSICPELSKIFPSNTNLNAQQTIPGEIDFYLNGGLRWGIELLINGAGISEHISRFTPPNGKYVLLNVKDYAVVDFRRNESGQPSKHPNRISVFFKNDDYSVARCVFNEVPTVFSINLAN